MIIGTIKKLITTVLKCVYKILSIFNLQFALLVAIVGVVLYFCGVFEGGGFALLIFCLSFICSVILAVFLTAKKILGVGKKEREKTPVQILQQAPVVQQPQQVVVQAPPQQVVTQTVATQHVQPMQSVVEPAEQPRYFRVKQNPNYVMAEYSDRYELYLITPQGLRKVRTDLKG